MALVEGDDGPNVLNGTTEADNIKGFGGDDTINAFTRPTAVGSLFDVVDGGDGADTLIVNASAETQSVQLILSGNPRHLVRSTSGNFAVDAFNIEKVRFTGGSGNDTINTGDTGVLVNGGAGIDQWIANLGALTTGVNFILGQTTAIGAAGLTSILNIERIDLTTGSGNDTVTGGAQADRIVTGVGNDVINAKTRPTAVGSLFDVVDGGDGVDTLIVNASAETQSVQLILSGNPRHLVRSASGNFAVDAFSIEKVHFTGGSGNDVINTADTGVLVDGGAGIDQWIANLGALTTNVNFILGKTAKIPSAGLVSIQRIERIDLTTGSGNDRIAGGAQGDRIVTGDGNDTIDAGSRPKATGSPIDVVDGGAGVDMLIVDASAETKGVQLILSGNPRHMVRSDSGNFVVDAFNIEKVRFTGGSGKDVINTGDTGVAVDGGGGIDHWIANLSAVTKNIVFDLATTTKIGVAGLLSIANIERIDLTTGSGNDKITGGSQGDRIVTGAGNDVINAGTRTTATGAPIDVVDGGAGVDTLIVDASAEKKAVQLIVSGNPNLLVRSESGRFAVDGFNIEKAQFHGGSGNDTATGLGSNDTLNGNGGNDTATGLGSNDTLNGNGGNDRLNGGAGNDTISGDAGNDRIDGGAGKDGIDGGAGNDTLIGGAGGDTLTGGAGRDTFLYAVITDSAGGAANRDRVTDFVSKTDTFDLSQIDANTLVGGNQAFAFIGRSAFSGVAGELRAVAGRIEADVDGDGKADFRVDLANNALAVLGDFIL